MKKLPLKPQIFHKLFEAFPGFFALLDEKGNILLTNTFWQKKALQRGMLIRPDSIGYNYLELCDKTQGEEKEFAQKIKEGILKVLKGEFSYFFLIYELKFQTAKEPYLFLCYSLKSHPKMLALLHLKLPQEKELVPAPEGKSEINIPFINSLLSQLRGSVLPFLELLKGKIPGELEETREKILEDLKELEKKVSLSINPLAVLTPREAQIALLVKEGKTSEEIAKLLNLGKDAVDFYRKRIREKLGLKGKSPSLRTYLKKFLKEKEN